jgi:hypothetical protein
MTAVRSAPSLHRAARGPARRQRSCGDSAGAGAAAARGRRRRAAGAGGSAVAVTAPGRHVVTPRAGFLRPARLAVFKLREGRTGTESRS